MENQSENHDGRTHSELVPAAWSYAGARPSTPLNVISGYLSLDDIIGPGGLLPISKSTLYDHVDKGLFPENRKFGGRAFWLKSEVFELLDLISRGLDWRHRSGKASAGDAVLSGTCPPNLNQESAGASNDL